MEMEFLTLFHKNSEWKILKSLEMYMRVNRIFKNVKLEVRSGDTVIHSAKKVIWHQEKWKGSNITKRVLSQIDTVLKL